MKDTYELHLGRHSLAAGTRLDQSHTRLGMVQTAFRAIVAAPPGPVRALVVDGKLTEEGKRVLGEGWRPNVA